MLAESDEKFSEEAKSELADDPDEDADRENTEQPDSDFSKD